MSLRPIPSCFSLPPARFHPPAPDVSPSLLFPGYPPASRSLCSLRRIYSEIKPKQRPSCRKLHCSSDVPCLISGRIISQVQKGEEQVSELEAQGQLLRSVNNAAETESGMRK
eukprot:1309026-Rhodomonas_salina.4